jgi:hypothetical protein
MRLLRRPSLALAPLLVVLAAAGTSAARSLPAARPSENAEHREVVRIQAHFDSVLSELASNPAPNRIEARARRSALARTLRSYRDAGVFPHNYDFPGRAVPYFVDRGTGTLCAVAHLLASTGRRDIVDRVARANNNVWVAELAGDTALTRWLDLNGITLAEAARIQVPYVQPSTPAQVARNTTFLAIAPVALGAATVTTMINALGNADGHRRSARIVGLTSGIITAGAGGLLMGKDDRATRQVGAATVVMGGLSVALASRATHRHNAIVAQQREADRAHAVQATLSPIVPTSRSGAGVSLAIRY